LTALATACLAPEGVAFVAIVNHEGNTALHVAFKMCEQSVARTMAENLAPHLNDAMRALLTDVLRLAAVAMPEAVLPLLRDIELTVLFGQSTLRILHHRAEVIGLATSTLPSDDPNDVATFESEGVAGLKPADGLDLIAPWKDLLPSSDARATYTLVCFKALKLADLAGDRRSMIGGGAFHAIVANCDVSVFESKLL
jgi:hypothetical protein